MMKRLVCAVLVIAAGWGVLHWRRQDVSHSLNDISYSLHCASCKAETHLTTAELNRMIARGEATSPPQQMRQFKCEKCGKLELVMDAGMPHAAR